MQRKIGGNIPYIGTLKKTAEIAWLTGCTGIFQVFGDLKTEDIRVAEKLKTLVQHQALNSNLSNPQKCGAGIMSALKDIQKLDRLPMETLYVVHPGAHVGKGTATGIRTCVESLDTILENVRKTKVLVEMMPGEGTQLGATLEELSEILSGVKSRHQDRLGVCLDTCHMWAAGYDIADKTDEVMAAVDAVVGLSRVGLVHLNGSMDLCGAKKDRHTSVATGQIPLQSLLRVAYYPGLETVPLILEVPRGLPALMEDLVIVKSLG